MDFLLKCALVYLMFVSRNRALKSVATKPLDSLIPLCAGTSPFVHSGENWLSIILSKRSHNLLPPYSGR